MSLSNKELKWKAAICLCKVIWIIINRKYGKHGRNEVYNKENRNRGTNETVTEKTVNRNSRKVFHEQSAVYEH